MDSELTLLKSTAWELLTSPIISIGFLPLLPQYYQQHSNLKCWMHLKKIEWGSRNYLMIKSVHSTAQHDDMNGFQNWFKIINIKALYMIWSLIFFCCCIASVLLFNKISYVTTFVRNLHGMIYSILTLN